MSHPRSLSELRARLSALGRRDLLALSINDARRSIPNDEVGRILAFLGERLRKTTIDSLLSDAEAQRVVEGALSRTHRDWLIETMVAWADGSATEGPRRVAPWALGDEDIEKPERTSAAIEKFALAHGLSARLEDLATAALDYVDRSALDPSRLRFEPGSTIADLAARRHLPTGMASKSLAATELADAARSYIHAAARAKKVRETHEARYVVRPSTKELRMLAAQLAALDETLGARPLGMLADDQAEIVLDREIPRFETTFTTKAKNAYKPPAQTTLDFDGFEHGHIELACTCIETKPATCAHARRLLDQIRDVAHDVNLPLHDALSKIVAEPSHARMLARVESLVSAGKNESPAFKLAVRLARDGSKDAVSLALRRRGKNGVYSAGTITSAERVALELETLENHDRAVVDAVLGVERSVKAKLSRAALAEREAAVLRAIVNHPEVYAADDGERIVRVAEATPTIFVLPLEQGYRIEVRLGGARLGERAFRHGRAIIAHEVDTDTSYVALLDPTVSAVADVFNLAPIVPRDALDSLLAALVTLEPRIALALPPSLEGSAVRADDTAFVRLEPLENRGLRVELRVRPLPGTVSIIAGEGPDTVHAFAGGERRHARRDRQAELRAAETLRARLPLSTARVEGPLRFVVEPLEAALDVVHTLAELGDVRVEWPEGQTGMRVDREVRRADLHVRVGSLDRWLGIDGEAKVDENAIPLARLLDVARRGGRYVEVSKGRFARIEAALSDRLVELDALAFKTKSGLALGKASVLELTKVLAGESFAATEQAAELISKLDDLGNYKPPKPRLTTELRSYQLEGYEFLARLAHLELGALLADEMGLGKTIQTLALLDARAHLGPALVLAPTSVCDNWCAEAERFAPNLRPVLLRGASREKALTDLGPGDVLVASYEVATRDADKLAHIELATLVIDEAQALKNPRTKRARAVRTLRAGFRLALSGTPMENHLGELFATTSLVLPGLLGTWETFRDRFAIPIERDGDERARLRLRRMISPYLLRRTKSEVAPELPPRTEVLRTIELSGAESVLYEAARLEAISSLEKAPTKANDRRFVVLSALTRLRQLACHPRLVDGASDVRSSKLEAFVELAQDLVREGHRALVFSQFTSHLALVREALDARGYQSLYLDGGTPAKERTRLVEEFETGDAPLFLISLKAGGTGLNLVAADYVIHLDPWWNPAAEDQASDRAHRIGQTKPVTVVRMVTRGTIEEAVVALHGKKRALADAILAESATIAKVSVEELLDLLREGATMLDDSDVLPDEEIV